MQHLPVHVTGQILYITFTRTITTATTGPETSLTTAPAAAAGARDATHLEPLVCFIFYFITLIFILGPIATAAPPASAATMVVVALVSTAVATVVGAAAGGARDKISPALFFLFV